MTLIQEISANSVEQMEERIIKMQELGYETLGGLVCRIQDIECRHNIMGVYTKYSTYYTQQFWKPPANRDSDNFNKKAVDLLQKVVDNQSYELGDSRVDIDKDIIEVIEEFLAEESQ